MNKKFTVSIIGRPNVGKSTLFNRLVKKRISIVDDKPGVTRDIIRKEIILEDTEIILQDTGGLTDENDILNKFVQEKTLKALKESDLIIFLVEANNILPIEEEYIKLIRKSGKDAFIAMNKSDSPEKDIFINEFYKYGFDEIIPISSSHNRNIDILIEKILQYAKKYYSRYQNNNEHSNTTTQQEKIKISIVGKPNVGKSSLLNKITNTDRSIVSNIPGTTRDCVDESIQYKNYILTFLDTAGIRRKSKVVEDIEYYSVNRSINAIEEADITLLVIDSLEEVSEQDKKITDQIVKNGKGLIVCLNKIDLITDHDQLKKSIEQFRFKFPQIDYAPIVQISSLTGKGLKTLLNTIEKVYQNLNRKISTSELNDFIQDVLRKYSPSSKKGVLKIFYGVQSSVMPVQFIFFLNNTNLIQQSYKQYIANRLREYFKYDGVPIEIIYKNK